MVLKPRITSKELLNSPYDSYIIPSILFHGDATDRLSAQALLAYAILSDWSQITCEGIIPQTIFIPLANTLNLKPKETNKLIEELMSHDLIKSTSNGYKVKSQVAII